MLREWAKQYLRGVALEQEYENPDHPEVQAWVEREADALAQRLATTVESYMSHECGPIPDTDENDAFNTANRNA